MCLGHTVVGWLVLLLDTSDIPGLNLDFEIGNTEWVVL
jgi:hypothetical protein